MFYPLVSLADLYDGFQKVYRVENIDLLVCQNEGDVFIVENRCPHMDVSLERATLLAGQGLRCNAHGIEFSLSSGKAKGPLADTLECLKRFDVVYEGNQLGVELS